MSKSPKKSARNKKPAKPAKTPAAAPQKPASEAQAVEPVKVQPVSTNRTEPTVPLIHELQFYYDATTGEYLSPLNGRYVAMKKNDLMMRVRARGLSDKEVIFTVHNGMLRQTDYPFYQAQNERMIDFAGPLAGRRVGTFKDGVGKSYLVTDEAAGVWQNLIKKPAPKFFPSFIEELLPGDQADHFCFWLALSISAMRAVDFSPGQACIFAGPPKCGKSLLQHMITELLGGRAANPYKYLMGENFNKDLIASEHWMVEDPGTSTDIRTRREFGEKIKEATVNRDIRINGKGKDAGLFQIFRRCTISVNNEKESLAVCPPMVEGVADKINLYSCAAVAKAFNDFRDKEGKPARTLIWSAFMAELHEIRSWLLAKFKRIPPEEKDDRMGIRAFHHPEILAELSSMTYESRFLELVDEKFFADKSDVWQAVEKKSSDWQKELLEFNRFETEKVLRYPGQCGSHLSKLAKSQPNRVTWRVLDGHKLWTINPPAKNEEQ